ncbi:hypothetical protein HPB50_026734 [Hyalomma asiaticum]|uniref:Uncharacterized protein n=1 Tax=Hyalomma asiaticum TaxID=266040 RepID=A0ACB7SQ47_HYAAI|nr:hypothetical protein HPB50_026734 [Hyalomma asiaticum]
MGEMEALRRKSNIRMYGGSFLMHRVYPDDVTFKLVLSAAEVLNMSPDACLEALGCHFLYFCQQHGYDKILRVLGSNLTDFSPTSTTCTTTWHPLIQG